MADDEMEDYGFEYSDEDPEEEDVDVENQYYNSKGTYGPFYIVFFLGF
jgi:COP9 signalosome complex subunit 2